MSIFFRTNFLDFAFMLNSAELIKTVGLYHRAVSDTVSGEILHGSALDIGHELHPTTEIIEYAVCTIHPFDNTVIADAFGIDMSAEYPQFNLTYGEVIQNMANALKMTLYGTLGNGTAVPLTDAELIAFVKTAC